VRKIRCAVLCAAIVLSGAAFATEAAAMNVCGTNGCAPVLVKRIRVPPRNITNTAAPPLAISSAPAPAAAAPALPSLPSLSSLLSSLPSPLSLLGK
jgi:hypothetical protein